MDRVRFICRMVAEATRKTRKTSGRCGGGGSETRYSQAGWLAMFAGVDINIPFILFLKIYYIFIVFSFLS